MTFCGKVFSLSLLIGFDFDFYLEKKISIKLALKRPLPMSVWFWLKNTGSVKYFGGASHVTMTLACSVRYHIDFYWLLALLAQNPYFAFSKLTSPPYPDI